MSSFYFSCALVSARSFLFRVWTDGFGVARIQKIYGVPQDSPETRYSPAVCMGTGKAVINGAPDHKHISTSYVERQNLTMQCRCADSHGSQMPFQKRVENLEHAVALNMHYNFCRIHQTLRVTPEMEAGLSDHVWNIEELIGLLN